LKEPGIHDHQRNNDSEVSRKHGRTLIASLRQTYGPDFAPKFPSHTMLKEALGKLDEPSLSKLIADLEAPK
jgi:hypothetical protein